ncbi:unnamed protein product [Brassica napus]|uniref:(rape) hypothetical protein n=1 Tax=Brassica napus TaxID=3708 RepID=A0A816TK75_BRANA|nr:unnamed protein product [Brassica napus]CAF2098846.1 unnamed protein product [Brassica napus]
MQQVMEQEILMRRCVPRRCYGPVHPPRPIMYAHYPSPRGYFVVPVAPRLSRNAQHLLSTFHVAEASTKLNGSVRVPLPLSLGRLR